MSTKIGDQTWYDFDPAKGSRKKRPPLRKPVLLMMKSIDSSYPDAVVVGYRKDGAGDKQSPYFVTPGCQTLGRPYRWCDCLVEGFQMPYTMHFKPD